jgi:uncharacterized protein
VSLRIIRAKDCTPVPWKNGLGVTREIAVFPAGSDAEGFVWRTSVAEVNTAAPFSSFPGIDRSIVLLGGDGFTMTLDGTTVHPLLTPFEPFAFRGEAKVEVALAGGPTTDFNLMIRRDDARGSIGVWCEAKSYRMAGGVAMIYCARGRIVIADEVLDAGDAWLATTYPLPAYVTLGDDAVALAIHIDLTGEQTHD